MELVSNMEEETDKSDADAKPTMRRRVVWILLLSVVARLLWALDANPLLFIYDSYVTRINALGTATDNRARVVAADGERRAFAPGSTPLEGKTVWITGGSSGIGAELALQLASAGAGHLILSGRRREGLESVAQSCRSVQEIPVSIVPFDMLAGTDTLDAAVSAALEAAAPAGIDILVLNAGQYQCGPALLTDLDVALPHLMQVNVASPIQLSQKLMRKDRWKERRHGHIVTISSLMGRGASPLNAVYSATKHAMRGYFHSLAAEERSWLRVDVVLPGATDTGLWKGSWGVTGSAKGDGDGGPVEHGMSSSLIWVYLAFYEPMTFQILTNVIAPLRVKMWYNNGEDGLYLPTLLGQLWDCIVDYIRGGSPSLLP